LKKGDRIRLKVRTVTGWKGIGTVIKDQLHNGSGVLFKRDGHNDLCGCGALSDEVVLLRNQAQEVK